MNQVQEIIAQGIYDNGVFKISQQLDRDLYVKVNEVLERFGGKWNKKSGGHVFPYDPSDYLSKYLADGELPEKNPMAFFPTPKALVELMIEECKNYLHSDSDILESSAGTGSIIDGIIEYDMYKSITAVELDSYRFSVLSNKYKSHSKEKIILINDDFLELELNKKFDAVIINPPFSVIGNANCYIDHIIKSWSLLKDAGILAAITPSGWLTSQTKKVKEFRDFVFENGFYFENIDEAFKEVGTKVSTLTVILEKTDNEDYFNIPSNGYASLFDYHVMLYTDNDEDFQNEFYNLKNIFSNGIEDTSKAKILYLKVLDYMRKSSIYAPYRESSFQNFLSEIKESE